MEGRLRRDGPSHLKVEQNPSDKALAGDPRAVEAMMSETATTPTTEANRPATAAGPTAKTATRWNWFASTTV